MDGQDLLGLDIGPMGESDLFSALFLDIGNDMFEDLDFGFDTSLHQFPDLSAGEPVQPTFFPNFQQNSPGSLHSSDVSSVTLSNDESLGPPTHMTENNQQDYMISLPRTPLPAASKKETQQKHLRKCKSKAIHSNFDNRTKWDSSIVVFSTNPAQKAILRKRKGFSATRKREVALNRKIGACVHCKLKKTSCNFGFPCDICIRRAGNNVVLGQQLCNRKSLISTRFDNIDILNYGNWGFDQQELTEIEFPLGHPVQCVYIGYRPCSQRIWRRATWGVYDHHDCSTPEQIRKSYIEVVVAPFDTSSCMNYRRTRRISRGDEFYFELLEVPNPALAIEESTIPSVDMLLKAYHTTNHVEASHITGPSEGLCIALRSLLERYCSSFSDLPLKELVQKASRLQELFSLITGAISMSSSPDEGDFQHVSLVMQGAIRNRVAKEIVELEVEVLSKIDQLMTRAEGIGRQNPIAIWLILWTLVFTYKEHMINTWSWNEYGSQCYELSLQIYRILTSVYSALYKTTSPLTLDWRKEEVSQLLGHDPRLVALFCNVKTEMFWLQTEMNYLRPEDNLFKKLVVDNEVRLLEAHRKAAKKQGIL